MTREEDVSKKIALVRQYIDKRQVDGVLLSKIDNFAWITSGARSYITLNDTHGCASILITKEDAYVISKNIETQRLQNEELPDNFTILEYPWFSNIENVIEKIANPKQLLYENDEEFSDFLLNARIRLSTYNMERYKKVGIETAYALERSINMINPSMTEIEAGAVVSSELIKRGLDAILVLVFGDEGRSLYRHNLPRNVKIGNKCIVSVNTKMYGLIISATRTALFFPDKKFEAQYKKNIEIDAEILHATLKENSIGDVFSKIENAYMSYGYKNEWMLHHQGGIAGYNGREIIAVPGLSFEIGDNMAFAWNPTITGTKSEDTYIRTPNNMELISMDNNTTWPYTEIKIEEYVYKRPGILKLF